jgi:hypothetical protein
MGLHKDLQIAERKNWYEKEICRVWIQCPHRGRQQSLIHIYFSRVLVIFFLSFVEAFGVWVEQSLLKIDVKIVNVDFEAVFRHFTSRRSKPYVDYIDREEEANKEQKAQDEPKREELRSDFHLVEQGEVFEKGRKSCRRFQRGCICIFCKTDAMTNTI